MQTHAPHGMERTQTLHHIGLGLLHHIDVAHDDEQHQHHQNNDTDVAGNIGRNNLAHILFLLLKLCI